MWQTPKIGRQTDRSGDCGAGSAHSLINVVKELIARWLRYAVLNRSNALARSRTGDLFGARLSLARAEVREEAAELLRRGPDPLAAAAIMHRRARELWLSDLPLIGFDHAAVQYTRARVWQDCARTIDPNLPVVQPRLDWD